MSNQFSFLYLIQSSTNLPSIYNCLRSKSFILLSFKENTSDTTIFYPHSTWTTGRNKLREYALSMDKKYDYYIFLDEDAEFVNYTQDDGFNIFESLINKYKPKIANPNLNEYYSTITFPFSEKPLSEAQTTIWYDGMYNAFSYDILTNNDIFPYVDVYDHKTWWMSQYILIIKCSIYNINICLFPHLLIENKIHSEYPKENILSEGEIHTLNNTLHKNNLQLINTINNSGIHKITEFLSLFFKLFDKINIIDVGCAIGDFNMLINHLNKYSIGIDPLISHYKNNINYSRHTIDAYNVIYENAIDIEESIQKFNITSSLDTSSLKEFNYTEFTNNKNEKNKFYVPSSGGITNVVETTTTKTITLNRIIEQCNLKYSKIHILKIDAQGNDLNVVKSCYKYLKNIIFIVIESVYDDCSVLYKNSTHFSEDRDYLKLHGFELLTQEKLLESDCDCLFYNTNIIQDFDLNWDKKQFINLKS